MSQCPFSETEFMWLFTTCISWEFVLWFPRTFQVSDESLRGESRSGSQKVRVDAQSRRVFHIQTVGNGYIQTIAWSCHAAKMLNVLYSVDDTKLPGQWANLDSQGRGFDEESMQYHTAIEHLLKNKVTIFEICFSPSHWINTFLFNPILYIVKQQLLENWLETLT